MARPRLALLWLLGFMSAATFTVPCRGDELEEDHLLSMEFQTPHTKWAKPYARGKTRVLFFCNGRGTVPREIIELKQRFDLDAEAVFWARIVDSPKAHWHGGDLGVARMLQVLQRRFDCFVFIDVPVTHLPVEAQYRVLKPVTEGAGLVLVGRTDSRVLKPRRRVDPPPPFVAAAEPRGVYAVKKGRGVLLPKLPNIPYELGWETEYEYWAERFGRAILWAAGREPKVKVTRLSIEPNPVACADVTKGSVEVAWVQASGPLSLHLNVRRHDGRLIALKPEKTAAAAGRLRRPLPPLRAGKYHVDLHVTNAAGVQTWATAAFEVKSPRGVDAVALDRDWGEIGEQISGRVALAGEPRLRAERVRVALRDRRGRILDQAMIPAGGDVTFGFTIRPWFPMLVRAEAVLLSAGADVAMAYAYVNVTKRHRGQFNFLIWDVPRGPLAPYAEESLARLGTTLQLGQGAPQRVLAAYDIAWVQYTTRILAKLDSSSIMRPQCWNDEPAVNAHIQALAAKTVQSRRHGTFVYSLGDENHVRGSCTHPACLNAYRDYLRQQYSTIDALNLSWASKYRTFNEVTLLDPEDNDGKVALRQKNFPRWYDRQAFKTYNYVMYCKRFAQAYRAVDPKSRTGFEGAGRFQSGDDIDLFVRELEFWSPYPSPADEVLRSIAPRDFPRSNWMGYRKDADSLIWKYWRMVTRGCDSVWWWRWDCIGRFHGFLAPHLGPWAATRELVDETQIVRDGLGTLLINSDMLDNGIAMLYSLPSCYASRLEEGAAYGSNKDCHVAWHNVIRELGLQFRYVTDRMLRLGEFDEARYKAILLSRAEAIGHQEAAALDAFVRAGGTVISDVRPGIRNGHCKALQAGALDALFGIRRTGTPEPTKGQAKIGDYEMHLGNDQYAADPGIAVTTGQALGKLGPAPLMVVNRTGKGQTILLNLSPRFTPPLGAETTPEATATFFSDLLDRAGVTAPLHLQNAKGARVRQVETIRWRNGQNEIVALFRKGGVQEDITVLLPAPRHVYDLRHRKYHSSSARFPTRIHPNRPTFLVLATQPLPRPSAAFQSRAVERGAEAKLAINVPDAKGQHAIRVRATTPSGSSAEWLNQVALVGAEPVVLTIPIAHNDPAGTWTFQAIDLFTERAAKAQLIVR